RSYAIASPMQRAWHLLALEAIHPTLVALFQMLPILHGSTLITTPSTYPTFAWPRCEVFIGLLFRHRLCSAFYADLTLLLWPENSERRTWIAFEVHGLAAVVVRIEYETT